MIKSGFSPKALTQCVCKTDYFTHFFSIVRYLLVLWKRSDVLILQKRAIRIRLGSKAMKPAYFFKYENPNL